MILWTFQPYEVYDEIMQTGEYVCQPERSTSLRYDGKIDKHFYNAYQWMIKQMKEKIGNPPKGVVSPVWAWYKWDYKHQPPDFFDQAKNSIQVCMKIKIPDSEVLLSDFDSWHHVLGKWYLGSAKNQIEYDKEDKWFDSLSKDQAKKVMEESWQRIFDITPRHGAWTMNGGFVQGCFWKLKKEQICKVWRIEKGRKSYRLDLMTPAQIKKFKNI